MGKFALVQKLCALGCCLVVAFAAFAVNVEAGTTDAYDMPSPHSILEDEDEND